MARLPETGCLSVNQRAWGFTLGCLALGAVFVIAPIVSLIVRIPDDAFYYFTPAMHFARTGFSSFDGIHFTNGYQPLWFLVCAAVYKVFPSGGDLPFRVLLGVEALCLAGATMFLVRTLGRVFGAVPATFAAVGWFLILRLTMVDGLETGVTMLLYCALLASWVRFRAEAAAEEGGPSPRAALGIGTLCGLLFLGRTDQMFLVMAVSAALAWEVFRRPRRGWAFVCFAVPLALIAGGYLAVNLVTTHHLMPVSGAAKVFYSRQWRGESVASVGLARTVARQVLWPLTTARLYAAVGAIGPWVLLAAGAVSRRWRGTADRIRPLWPFFVGGTATYIFYSAVFFLPFTETPWYYGPQTVLAALVLAALLWQAHSPGRGEEDGRPGVRRGLPVFFAGAVITLYVAPTHDMVAILGALAAAYVVVRLAHRPGASGRLANILALAVAVFALVAIEMAFLAHDRAVRPSVSTLMLLVASIAVQAYLTLAPARLLGTRCGELLFAGFAVVFITATELQLSHRPPHGWNYNLYLGAHWSAQHLPPSARIWSGSAGILGYYSGHTVINSDGLANDFDFLENWLKRGRKTEYCRQYDYGIDCFPTDGSIEQEFPAGRLLTLPPELLRYPFGDGNLTRRLGIIQMNPSDNSHSPIRGPSVP
jgi:hypothetical protein